MTKSISGLGPIEAGKLRAVVTIQVRETSQDGAGQPITTWDTFAQVWAQVISVSGSESFTGQQLSPEVTHRIRMYWLDGVTPLHRILVNETGQVLDITAVNYAPRKIDGMTMLCKERIDWQAGN